MILFDVGGTLFEDGKCSPLEGLAQLRLLAKNPEATTDERLFQLWEEYMDEIDVPRKSKSGVGLDIPLCAPLKYAIMHSGLEFDLSTYQLEELFDRYNSTRELENVLKETDGTFMPKAWANNPAAQTGHGGMDYAMMEDFFRCLREGKAAISVREGIEMTIPGIYAEASAKRGGKVLKIKYPWDPDWDCEFTEAE